MGIKAVITALVLGSSSLALAAPAAPGVSDGPTPMWRDHNWTRPMSRPVTLADDLHVDGRAYIRVPRSSRAFNKLELSSSAGRLKIEKVAIKFANGRTQVVDVAAGLGGTGYGSFGKRSYTIDLAGGARSIQSIVVYGSTGRRGSLDVIAI